MTEFRIVDSTNASLPDWVINRLQQAGTNSYRDFAIVARFTDNTTGKLTVVAAGVGRGGTMVAGEYLTDSANLAQLQRAAAPSGNRKIWVRSERPASRRRTWNAEGGSQLLLVSFCSGRLMTRSSRNNNTWLRIRIHRNESQPRNDNRKCS